MTNKSYSYYSDTDCIRQALREHGSLTREQIVELTDLERPQISKALYQLKKRQEVIQEGDMLVWLKTEDGSRENDRVDLLGLQEASECPQEGEVVPMPHPTPENAAQGKETALPDAEEWNLEPVARVKEPKDLPVWGSRNIAHRLETITLEVAGLLDENTILRTRVFELETQLSTIREKVMDVFNG